MKSLKTLAVLGLTTLGVLALAGCPGKSTSPTSPNNPVPSTTPTHTPIPGISWFMADIADTNGTGSSEVVLALNGLPVTNANAVLSGPALTTPVTLSYNHAVTDLGTVYSDYVGEPLHYQAGQPYTLTTVAGGVTAYASLAAVGDGFTSAPDGSAVSWTVNGNSSLLSVFQYSSNQFTYNKYGTGISPASVPVTAYATPGAYRLEAFVYNYGATLTGGTVANSNPSALSAQAYYAVAVVSSPTATPTDTRTSTPTRTPTDTPTPTDTTTPTLTGTPTLTATNSPTATATDTPTDTATPTATSSPTSTATSTPSPTVTDSPTPTATPTSTPTRTPTATSTSTNTPSSPITTLSAFATFGSQFTTPLDIQYDNGLLWVSDQGNHDLTLWSTVGGTVPVTTITSLGGGVSLNYPYGMGVDPSGNVYLADDSNGTVYVFDSSGNYQEAVTSSLFPSPIEPQAVGVNAAGTTLYVGSYSTGGVCAIPITPGSPPSFGAAVTFDTSGSGSVTQPNGIGTDPNQNVWVADGVGARMAEFSPSGQFLMASSPGGSFKPVGIAFDASGNIYTGNIFGGITEFTNLGSPVTTIDASTVPGPCGITTDGKGTFYVVQRGSINPITAFH